MRKSAEHEIGDVLNLCYGAGFPPSDLNECGLGVISHGYSQKSIDDATDDLANMICNMESLFVQPLLTPDESVLEAMKLGKQAARPVVIADTQDNPGCGGSGDTTGMLEALAC